MYYPYRVHKIHNLITYQIRNIPVITSQVKKKNQKTLPSSDACIELPPNLYPPLAP